MILLLENKQSRQKNIESSLNNYSDCLSNILGDEACNHLLDDFLQDKSTFDKYDTIIIHESIYHDEERDQLFTEIKSYLQNKDLIKFSGNNIQVSLQEKNILQISPATLYENIEVFLDEYRKESSNILMLAYGRNWEMNILLNILEKLNIFIENNSKALNISIFRRKSGLSTLNELNPDFYKILFEDINTKKIDILEMEKIRNKFKQYIQESVNE